MRRTKVTLRIFLIASVVFLSGRFLPSYASYINNGKLQKDERNSSIPHELCQHSDNLEIGVCKSQGYKSYVFQSRNLTILVSLKHQNMHSVDDAINTFSMDIEAVLYWIDPGITSIFSDSDKRQGYIPLSKQAVKMIWIPEIYIFNLSDYKTFTDSHHVSSAKTLYKLIRP